jgi:hypothetical protein
MTESRGRDEGTRPGAPDKGDDSPVVDAAEDVEDAEVAEAAPPSQPSGSPPRLSPGLRASIPTVALLLLLAAASFIPGIDLPATGSDAGAVGDLNAVVTGLPGGAPVLVDIDGDLGTYPEIRYATRAALADLFNRGAKLAIVSFSAEGRAIAVAEIDRLRDLGAGPDRLVDLGFRSGGEPALVQLAGNGIGPTPNGPLADALRRNGPGSFRLALVIGGAEIGPRSWIEQVQPRLPDLPIAAITPSFLLPEVLPYRSSGQLIALVGTLPADLSYGKEVAGRAAAVGPGGFTDHAPNSGAIVFGMVVAIAVLLAASGGSLAAWVRAALGRPRS